MISWSEVAASDITGSVVAGWVGALIVFLPLSPLVRDSVLVRARAEGCVWCRHGHRRPTSTTAGHARRAGWRTAAPRPRTAAGSGRPRPGPGSDPGRAGRPGHLAGAERRPRSRPPTGHRRGPSRAGPVSYTHLRAHETRHDLVC